MTSSPARPLVEELAGAVRGSRRPHSNLIVYWALESLLLGPFFPFLLVPRVLRFKTLRYELYPLAITVDGDVAVAHYLYSVAFRDKEGQIEVSNGRYTDVLVRKEDGWKFIAWHGGDDD